MENLLLMVVCTMKTAFWFVLPFAVVSFAVGVGAGLFQTGTSIQDPSISTVPRLLAVGLAALLLGPWLLRSMAVLARTLFGDFSAILGA